jgi:hypothetical protein
MWPMVAMAAGSMLMNEMQRRETNKQNAAQAEAAAAQTQFSPWTKMGKGQAQYQQTQSNLAAGLQGGAAGASMAQQYDQAQSQKDLANAQTDYYRSNASTPWVTNAKMRGNQHQMANSNMGMGA